MSGWDWARKRDIPSHAGYKMSSMWGICNSRSGKYNAVSMFWAWDVGNISKIEVATYTNINLRSWYRDIRQGVNRNCTYFDSGGLWK